jgi:hypothetical protein
MTQAKATELQRRLMYENPRQKHQKLNPRPFWRARLESGEEVAEGSSRPSVVGSPSRERSAQAFGYCVSSPRRLRIVFADDWFPRRNHPTVARPVEGKISVDGGDDR